MQQSGENDTIKHLLKYQNEGFVFHGSPNPDIKILEPRPATDVDKSNAFNNDTAIFATRRPEASVIFGCMSLANLPKAIHNGSWSVGQENGETIVSKIPKVWKEYVSNNTGYVYVLDGKDFSGEGETEGGWQVKSKNSAVPIARVKVSFSDFEKLGGKLIWKDSINPIT